MDASQVTEEDMIEAEAEAFQRPSNSAMWDDRLYTSHAPVIGWAERGDDILAESNYACALELLQGAAGDNADEHVIDARPYLTGLVGSLRQIFVQARDEAGAFTDAWRAAVAMTHDLRDYPVLDESDYSEREWAEFERQFDDAITDARRSYERETDTDLTDEQHDRITAMLADEAHNGTDFHSDSYADCDYTLVSDVYAEFARDITGTNPDRPLVSLVRTEIKRQARMF